MRSQQLRTTAPFVSRPIFLFSHFDHRDDASATLVGVATNTPYTVLRDDQSSKHLSPPFPQQRADGVSPQRGAREAIPFTP